MSTTRLLVSVLSQYVLFRLFRFLSRVFSPSKFRDIPGPPSESWFKGNLGQLFNSKGLPFHQGIVDDFGGMVKVHGFFGDEQLYISDPRALQSIISKDQDAFEETAVFTETNKVIFGPGLVATTGDHHKRQRKIVTPIFSVAHLRQLTSIMYDIGDKLSGVLEREVEFRRTTTAGEGVLDMSEWMSRVALETVGQTILGYSFDPLDSPYNNPYTSAVKELVPTIFSLSLVRQFAPFLSRLGSPSFRRKLVEHTPNRAVQKVKNIADIMHNTATEILRQRRLAIAQEVENEGISLSSSPKDIISILLRANEKANHDEKLSEAELTGQMTVLIFGAQDTTSSTMSHILYTLSRHLEIQTKVRDEIKLAIRSKRAEGDFSERLGYDDIMSLPWLDSVIKETLRLYPPVPFVRRTAIKERTIPYSQTNASDSDGERTAYVTIPVGTTLFIGIAGSNRLESVWGADAKEWKPERWLDGDLDSKVRPHLPGIYSGMMSFFGGGRSCIGYKFAQVEMKILLATLLLKFEFAATDDRIVWNLSQIISPSVQKSRIIDDHEVIEEQKGLPLLVKLCKED